MTLIDRSAGSRPAEDSRAAACSRPAEESHPEGRAVVEDGRVVLRIVADAPLVWRDTSTLQAGIDEPRAVLTQVGAAQERLVHALRVGASRAALLRLAARQGLQLREADRVLDALAPVLEELAEAEAGPAPPDEQPLGEGGRTGTAAVSVRGPGPAARLIRELLGPAPAGEPALVVLVADHVVEPVRYRALLREDIPHLPVVHGERRVRVGPLVQPGLSACLRCAELHHSDADPAWPAIAAQALGRAGTRDGWRCILAASETVAAVAAWSAGASHPALSAGVVVEAGGVRALSSPAEAHPSCSCRTPPGSAKDRVDDPSDHSVHMTGSARPRPG